MSNTPSSHWIMDYETLINCFIGVFVHYKEDTSRTYVVNGDQNDFPSLVKFLQDCADTNQWHISFNGLEFDAQISQYILSNKRRLLKLSSDELSKDIYEFAQKVINGRQEGQFLPYRPSQLKINQIDLFKLNHWDNKAKMSGLKWIQYSMDWNNVEEMPHPHYTPVVDPDTRQQIINYCFNDVLSTKNIYKSSKEQIQLRQQLTREYGINLFSASEPRISKELFLHFLEQKTGIPKADLKIGRTPRRYIVLADCILPYVQFKTPEFQAVHEYFLKTVITSTKDKLKYTLNYRGVQTDYGLGGLHGAAKEGIYEATPGWTIMSSDVVSFYPNLSIKNRFAPEHLPKEAFCELYEWTFEERKKIPKSNPKNYVFKIILNSTYGLTGDETSFLYDPKMTMQITVNGQLLLSMLYEMIGEEIPAAMPLMQNTDGLETMIPTADVVKYMEICTRWERLTNLSLEHEQYSKMVIRDVNNYIAVTTAKEVRDQSDGTPANALFENMRKKNPSYVYHEKGGRYFYQATKCKGAFEWEDLDKKKVSVLHKNKSFLVIPKAIYAYFVHGVKPEEYLKENDNIYDYCAGVKAKGAWGLFVYEGFDKIPIQKIVRYFVSNDGVKLVKCHPDGREIQVDAGLWRHTVINKIDQSIPFASYNINKEYYLQAVYRQLEQIEKVSPKTLKQLTLF